MENIISIKNKINMYMLRKTYLYVARLFGSAHLSLKKADLKTMNKWGNKNIEIKKRANLYQQIN